MAAVTRLVFVAQGRQAAVYRLDDTHVLKVPWVAMSRPQAHAVLQLIARLPGSHPNVVRVLRLATVEHKTGVLMEHIRGPTLTTLARTTMRRADMSAGVCWDVLHGLEYMHSHGVLHLDVAPDNVLFCVDTSLFVLIDVALHRAEFTPSCMSPDRTHCEQSDTWSLGCTLLYVLTGTMPWTSCRDRIEVFVQLYAKRTPPELQAVPSAWQPAMQGMLCTETALRPTARDMLHGKCKTEATSMRSVHSSRAYTYVSLATPDSTESVGADVDTVS